MDEDYCSMKSVDLTSGPNISVWQYAPDCSIGQIHEGEIHIWQADLLLDGQEAYWNTLSADEKERANRFHFERDRRRYIVARGSLRKLLGGYLDCEPGSLQFAYGAQGKPFLASWLDVPNLHFNVTHSVDSALLAFAHQEIGIDIEAVSEHVDVELIAPGVFSPSELAQWQALPASEKRSSFFSLWTRKEALVKALGRGIGYPLTEVSVNFSSCSASQITLVRQLYVEAAARSIWEIPVAADFRAAIAI